MSEFDVTIHVRMKAGQIETVNDRIDRALDRAFPSSRKDVLELSWETREDVWAEKSGPSFESLATMGACGDV